MKDLTEERGRCDVIVCCGRISLSEIASLEEVSVVTVSDRVAGTLQDLSGIGEYGLVNFGVEPGSERRAELAVADRVIALGTVGFTGRSWVLSVEEIKATAASRPDYYSTGAAPVLDV